MNISPTARLVLQHLPPSLCTIACIALFAGACIGRTNVLPQGSVPQTEITVTQAPATPLNEGESKENKPPTILESQSLLATPLPTAIPQALPRPRYQITATLDYRNHHLSVEERIEYTNTSDESIPDLVLIIEPLRYPAVFRLNRLAWEDGRSIEGIIWEVNRLRFSLPQALKPGERLALNFEYELNLPSPDPAYYGRPVPFGYTVRQTNLVDWYPFIPPYVPGQGWLVHDPWFYGEHLVYETAEFQVDFRLADAPSSATAGGGQALTVAASAPASTDGEWYHYHLPVARNFALSASDMYQVLTTTVGDVTVLGYAFPFHARAGEAALKTTADALLLFNRLYGLYPHTTLSVVEADFLDGMEYDGLYFLSNGFYNLYNGSPGEYLSAIAAHETSHQWFYGLVGNDQAMEPWLDEALATYSERLFYENLYPQALDWWWEYRVRYYQPHGWVDGTIYNPEGYRSYRDAVYLNGAMFLEDLRNRVGDQVFFAFLSDYIRRFSYQRSTTQDFFTLLRQHTAISIEDLVHLYLNIPIYP